MFKWKNCGVTLFQSDLYETNSLVVETADCVLVVDPCWLPREVEEIRQYVENILDGRRLLLLFTHSDYDHIIGYGAFREAEVIASRAFAGKSEEEQKAIIEDLRTFDDNYYLRRPYETIYPAVDHIIEEDGQTLVFEDMILTCYAAPGHTDDGMFTIVKPLGLFIAGDYLSDVEFPYIYDSSRSYEQTLGKLEPILAGHTVNLLVPGHGGTADSHFEILRRKAAGLAYIDDLRTAVAEGVQEDADRLIEGCEFPRNMAKFHQSNAELIKKELDEAAEEFPPGSDKLT